MCKAEIDRFVYALTVYPFGYNVNMYTMLRSDEFDKWLAGLKDAKGKARIVAALEHILAPGFVYTNASGEVLDKESYLARCVRDPDVRWLSQELAEVVVRVVGDTAVVTCQV